MIRLCSYTRPHHPFRVVAVIVATGLKWVEADGGGMGKSPNDATGLYEDPRLIAPPVPVLEEPVAVALLSLLLQATSNEQRDIEDSQHDEALHS